MPQVTMPQLGEGVEEGTIGKWLKAVGDKVRVGDPLVEVVTDKVNAEVPSPFEGTLTSILVNEGDTVGNDAPIAEIDEAGAGASAPQAEAPAEQAAAEQPAEEPTAPEPAAEQTAKDTSSPRERVPAEASAGAQNAAASEPAAQPARAAAPVAIPADVRMTPAVRRLARELRVDVAAIAGSGLGGRITRSDVEAAAPGATNGSGPAAPQVSAAPQAPATPVAPPSRTAADPLDSPVKHGDSLKELTPMRKAIARHMERFLEVPAAYITIEVDMTPVVQARAAINADYKSREGMSMSYVAYMTKACVEALRKFPDFNAHWTDEGHWRRKSINIGIAVAVDDGLVVPVIKDAQNLSLHGLNAAINDVAARARSKKLAPSDLEGGTFTVDNTGWTGSILTLPIINVPEVAIITMERIVKRPVVLEDHGDAIAVRSMMNMCIAIDHRANDGAQAGAFLQEVQGWLEAVDADTPIW
jgi:pyruvate/2-oxoglutarate dehydrogenase complex dihydrolipoamide acyltransferase (E2) component